jgi:hypothetical protein
MWEQAGPSRSREGLEHALARIHALRRELPDLAISRRRERKLARRQGGSPANKIRRPVLVKLALSLGQHEQSLLKNPVFLKEIRSEFFGRVWYQRLLFFLPLILFTLLTLVDDDLEAKVLPPGLTALGLIILLVPGVAASSIPREIEQGNLDFLRGTLLPLSAVLRGKFMAGILAVLGMMLAAALVLAIAPQFSTARSWSNSPPHAVMILWSYLVSAAILGLTLLFTLSVASFFAVVSRRTLGALMGSYITLLALYLLFPIICALIFRYNDKFLEVFLPATNPFGAYVVCIDKYPRNIFEAEKVLLLFTIFHAGAMAALYLVSNHLIEKLRARDP